MVLESFDVSGSSLGLLGVDNAPLVLNSLLMPSLTAGTQYWVTVKSDSNDTIAWNENSTGDSRDEALSVDGGATWFSSSGLTPGAFQVNGASSTSVTPEPSRIALTFTGLMSLAVRRPFGIRGWRANKAN